MTRKVAPFRIAMRGTADGWWVGMMAPIDSMENTLELGRIRLRAAQNETIRKAFIEVLKMMMTDAAKEKGIGVAEWQMQKPMPPSKGRA
jgi:hypothetical protein